MAAASAGAAHVDSPEEAPAAAVALAAVPAAVGAAPAVEADRTAVDTDKSNR